ncbi:MAG: hypothetical protein ACOC3T_00745 [Bacteroidota bacterium]|jgi:hypothetical protein
MNKRNTVSIVGTVISDPYVVKADKKYLCFFDISGKTFQYADKDEIVDIDERFTVINIGRQSSYFFKRSIHAGMELWVYGNLKSVEHQNEDGEIVRVNYLNLRDLRCNDWI